MLLEEATLEDICEELSNRPMEYVLVQDEVDVPHRFRSCRIISNVSIERRMQYLEYALQFFQEGNDDA
jgi:hypothetical protein